MRIIISFLAFLLLTACNSNNEKEKQNPPTREASPDSSGIVHPERALNAYAPVDRSPMDMSYYPAEYPKLKMSDSLDDLTLKARVIYSRPYLQGRQLFPAVLKYGEPWRLGANEATELDLYTRATIQGKKINAGRYVLYCIPQPGNWTIVLNSNIDSWGLHPDPAKDIARFTIPAKETSNFFEFFTMVFEKTTTGADLVMAWERTEARLPVSF